MAKSSLPAGVKVSYRQQYRRCGKSNCPRCTGTAKGHGPYWYAYWWQDGKVHSRYVGKQAPVAMAGAGAEIASPEQVAHRQAPHDPQALRVRTLGGFAVWRGDTPIATEYWSRRKKMTGLFQCLVSVEGHRLHRDQLIDLLWPEGDPGTGDTNLRYTLHLLRKVLDQPDSGWSHLQSDGEFVVLSPARMPLAEAAWLDAAAFLQATQAALHGTSAAACLEARALYTGEYLPAELYADWATTRRDQVRQHYLSLLLLLADLHLQDGRRADAIEPLQEVLQIEPGHELAARTLMRAQASLGRRTDAVHTYRRLHTVLRDELNLAPDRETARLYAALCAPSAAESSDRHSQGQGSTAPVQPALDALFPAADTAQLIGRAEELQSLLGALARARSGHGTLMALGGGAGEGKSSLLRAFIRRAREDGALVLMGSAYLAEGQLPYGPLQDALRSFVSAQPTAVLESQRAYHAVLRRLLPELDHQLPGLPTPAALDARAERHRVFAALAGLLADLGAVKPVVLALEDLHWADDTTVEAVHYLARTARNSSLLIVATYRTDDPGAPEPLTTFAADLATQDPDAVLTLGPLPHAELAVLVARLCAPTPVDPAVVAFIEQRSRGNPLFAGELVLALRQASRIEVAMGCWRLTPDMAAAEEEAHGVNVLPVPGTIQRVMRERLSRLGTETRRLLALCAVLGQNLSYAVLRAACDTTEETLLDSLEALLATGVLDETTPQSPSAVRHPEDALAYAFRHPLIREAIYESISTQRRQSLHARAGSMLEQHYGEESLTHAAELAWHFACGGQFRQAALYAERAGDLAASTWAGGAALKQYLTARAHLARVPAGQVSDTEAVSLLDEKIGGMRLLIGDFEQAQEDFARARSGTLNVLRQADLWRKEGESWLRRGDYEQALAAFDAGEKLTEPLGGDDDPSSLPHALLAQIELGRSAVQYHRGDLAAAGAASAHVVALLGAGHPTVAARAYQQLGNVATQQGDLERGEGWFRRALSLWEEQPEDQRDQQSVANAWNGLGVIAVDRGDHAEAESCHRRALAIRERTGDQPGIAASWNNLGVLAHDKGDLSAALLNYQRSVAVFERIGDQSNLGGLWNNIGDVLLAQGDLAAAEHYQLLSLRQWEQIGNQSGVGVCLMNLAAIHLVRGDLEQAETHYRRALVLMEQVGMQEYVAGVWGGLGTVALERGQVSLARAYHHAARKIGMRIGNPAVVAEAALGAAHTYLRSGALRAVTPFRIASQRLAAVHGLAGTAIKGLLLEAEQRLCENAPQRAQAAAMAAIHTADEQGRALDAARGRYLLGLSVAAGGAYEEARCLLEQALHQQTTAGASLAAGHTSRDLQRLPAT